MPEISKIKHKRERQFAETFFDHDEWEYEPGPFRLSNGETYRPDFLDKKRNVLIEVVGSRQAFHSNKDKYAIFDSEELGYEFELRNPDGTLYRPEAHSTFLPFSGTFSLEDIKERIKVLIELPGWSLNRVAKESGLQQASLWRFLYDENTKSISGQYIEKIWPMIYPEVNVHKIEDESIIDEKEFNLLKVIFGNHTQAAKAIGVHPVYYRSVRASGKVSRFVKTMIEKILAEYGKGYSKA